MTLCGGENGTEASRLLGLFVATNPPTFFLVKEQVFSVLLPLSGLKILCLLLRYKSTALAVALHHTWYLSREKVGGCQLGHEESIWVLRVMEICVGNTFPREFWAACG